MLEPDDEPVESDCIHIHLPCSSDALTADACITSSRNRVTGVCGEPDADIEKGMREEHTMLPDVESGTQFEIPMGEHLARAAGADPPPLHAGAADEGGEDGHIVLRTQAGEDAAKRRPMLEPDDEPVESDCIHIHLSCSSDALTVDACITSSRNRVTGVCGEPDADIEKGMREEHTMLPEVDYEFEQESRQVCCLVCLYALMFSETCCI
jgi:hypothetical protein